MVQSVSVSRRVVGYKKGKGKAQKKQPFPQQADNQSGVITAMSSRPLTLPKARAPVHTPWWKMIWIPLGILLVLALCLQLATGLGDNLRQDSIAKQTATSTGTSFPSEGGNVQLEKRTSPTDESFRSTHYHRSGTSASALPGGQPRQAAAKPKTVTKNCVVNAGSGSGSSEAILNLTACLAAQ